MDGGTQRVPVACCARAANGQLTAAPTESAMKLRRRIRRPSSRATQHSICFKSRAGIVHHNENTRSCRRWVARRHSRTFSAFPLSSQKADVRCANRKVSFGPAGEVDAGALSLSPPLAHSCCYVDARSLARNRARGHNGGRPADALE